MFVFHSIKFYVAQFLALFHKSSTTDQKAILKYFLLEILPWQAIKDL